MSKNQTTRKQVTLPGGDVTGRSSQWLVWLLVVFGHWLAFDSVVFASPAPGGSHVSATRPSTFFVIQFLTGTLFTIKDTATPRQEDNFEGKTTITQYYAYNKPQKVTLPGNIVIEYQYDAWGRVFAVHPAGFASDKWSSYV
jgi:YD repeat-containing protein